MKYNVLDHGYVTLIEEGTWGSDQTIIESARMSTDGNFKGWDESYIYDCSVCAYHAERSWGGVYECPVCKIDMIEPTEHKKGDSRLLTYLYTHKHMTPFEMAGMTIEVQAPIMVFREWMRHRTQSYNEMSARYVELPDLFYIPSIERLMGGKQSKKNKQGSKEGFDHTVADNIQVQIGQASAYARATYTHMLARGLSRELARLVLPVNQYSRMRASANLRNWLGFLTLRQDPSAQWEIREFANAVGKIIQQQFPRTWELFTKD